MNNSPVSRLSRLCRRSTMRSSSLASSTTGGTSTPAQSQQQQSSSSSVGGSSCNVMVDPTVADWLSFRQQQRSTAFTTTTGATSTCLDPSSAGATSAVPSLAFTLDDRFSRASSYSPEPVSLLTSPSLLQHRPEDSTYTSSGLVYLQRGITLQSSCPSPAHPLEHRYSIILCAALTETTTTTISRKRAKEKQEQVYKTERTCINRPLECVQLDIWALFYNDQLEFQPLVCCSAVSYLRDTTQVQFDSLVVPRKLSFACFCCCCSYHIFFNSIRYKDAVSLS